MNSPDWIDGHCHLADLRLEDRIDTVIDQSKKVGVCAWVQGGVNSQDWERQLALRKKFGPGVILSFGLHPWEVRKKTTPEIATELTLLENQIHLAQALGELGLDFGPKNGGKTTQEAQTQAFERQLQIAKDNHKPLILHILHAHSEALEVLHRHAPFPDSGLVHSYSGSAEQVKEYLNLGFSISIGGSITQKGFKKLKTALKWIPLERLIIETDSPDQLPQLEGLQPGGLNQPSYLIGIAEAVGSHLGLSGGQILSQSTRNLRQLFRC